MGFKNLETYISELLYRYNLVILPGLGALVGRRNPAKVQTEKGIFMPPSKEISFNGLIVKDDGLLINHIAATENVPYETAEKYVLNVISRWRNELIRNKRLRLDNIGFFTKTNEKILFTPYTGRNYLPEAFGLNTFVRKPLEKSIAAGSETDFNTSPEPKTGVQPGPKRQKIPAGYPVFPQSASAKESRWIKYAAAAVIAVSLLWGGYHFRDSILGKDRIQVQQATYRLPGRFPEIVIPADRQPETTDAATNKNYYIIVGAFKNRRNAERLVTKLQAEGVEASIPGQNPDGLYYVAYASLTSADKAEEQLLSVKQSFQGAWILER
jgi:nucleoid DNA-binding protein